MEKMNKGLFGTIKNLPSSKWSFIILSYIQLYFDSTVKKLYFDSKFWVLKEQSKKKVRKEKMSMLKIK